MIISFEIKVCKSAWQGSIIIERCPPCISVRVHSDPVHSRPTMQHIRANADVNVNRKFIA